MIRYLALVELMDHNGHIIRSTEIELTEHEALLLSGSDSGFTSTVRVSLKTEHAVATITVPAGMWGSFLP